jgi:2',3'-cyclic-nucleotide 2'-phosphodiesterase (5'-nucleotidase family)
MRFSIIGAPRQRWDLGETAARRAATAFEPMVHTIILLSHLGFDNDVDSDVHLIPFLRGSKVSAILGGHTHDALDPAYVIDGIVTCNGAHTA